MNANHQHIGVDEHGVPCWLHEDGSCCYGGNPPKLVRRNSYGIPKLGVPVEYDESRIDRLPLHSGLTPRSTAPEPVVEHEPPEWLEITPDGQTIWHKSLGSLRRAQSESRRRRAEERR